MRSHFLAAFGAAALLLGLAAPAHAEDWDRLGSRTVAFGGDHDTLTVTGDGRYTGLRLDVDQGNLEMYDIRILFGNGETFAPSTRLNFQEATRSRTIDLPGQWRIIRKIEFWYRSTGQRGRSTVTVFGRRWAPADSSATPPAPPASPPAGAPVTPPAPQPPSWLLLGSRIASFAADRDAIDVTAQEGRFRKIRIDVERGNVDMWDVKVTFGDGQTFSPSTRLQFRVGSMSREIDLPGNARAIRKVEFLYRSDSAQGRATVSLYGLPDAGTPAATPAVPAAPLQPPPAVPAPPAHPGWELLGTRVAAFGGDHDAIDASGEGRFTALMVEVENGDLEMYNTVVAFGNGERVSPGTRLLFQGASRTRVIDLPGNRRMIRRVEFAYRSIRATADGKAIVRLYGRR